MVAMAILLFRLRAITAVVLFFIVTIVDARPRLRFIPRQEIPLNLTSPDSGALAANGTCNTDWFNKALDEMAAADKITKISLIRTPKSVDAGGSFGGETDDPENGQFAAITDLPSLCAVKFHVEVNATDGNPASSYDFGIFFPNDWKKGMLTVGGESFGGGINWPNMGQGVHYGFATVSTNNGHNSLPGNMSWAKGDEGRKQDWGFRAIHGSVVLGKELVARFYDAPEFKSYYSGCSTGGRQGLRELADHVDSFDGLLIGAPAWDTVNISPWMSYLSKILSDNGGPLTLQEIQGLTAQVTAQCDNIQGSDKIPDQILTDSAACYAKFNMTPLFCAPGATIGCMEEKRARAVLPAFYEPYKVPSSVATPELVSPGYDMGSEWMWPGIFGIQADGTNLLNAFNMDYERNFLNQADADVATYSDAVVAASRADGAGKASVPPFDLAPFGARGGRLILYHGMADGLLPRANTERWYNAAGGAGTAAFARYFEVPGMGHCAFSSPALPFAPWIFGGAGQAAALKLLGVGDGFTNFAIPGSPPAAEADALTALVNWVAGGDGPTEILAGSLYHDPRLTPARPWTTRLCAYPKKAVLTGSDMTSKDSYTCQ